MLNLIRLFSLRPARFLLAAGLACTLTALAPIASADVLEFTLGSANNTIENAGGTGPYGTITVSVQDGGGTATIDVIAESPYQFGDGAMLGFNVQGSLAGLTIAGPSTMLPFTCCTSQNLDGFGIFEVVVKNFDGFATALSTFTLTVNRTGGFSSASQLMELSSGVPGNGPAYFAARTFMSDSVSGFTAAQTEPSQIPEPGTMALSALGLMVCSWWARRRRL